jgi:hypothetical protein
MMTNWWPLSTSRLEDPRYQSLTAAERLYLEYLISTFSLRGSSYESDLEIATTLGLSEDKIRRARRRVGRPSKQALTIASRSGGHELRAGFGWVIYTPGLIAGGRNLATRYLNVPILKVPKGEYFAPVHRFTFEALLAQVRSKQLTHADVVVWLVLAYKYSRCKGKRKDHTFFITKKELVRLSGVANAPTCVGHLYGGLQFTSGHHLFEYSDQGQRLLFSKWALCADPSEHEGSANALESWRQEIAGRVHDKRLVARLKQANQLARRSTQTQAEAHPSIHSALRRAGSQDSTPVG